MLGMDLTMFSGEFPLDRLAKSIAGGTHSPFEEGLKKVTVSTAYCPLIQEVLWPVYLTGPNPETERN